MSKKHSRLFRISIYNILVGIVLLNEVLYNIYYYIEGTSLTQFYLVIAALTKEAYLYKLLEYRDSRLESSIISRIVISNLNTLPRILFLRLR